MNNFVFFNFFNFFLSFLSIFLKKNTRYKILFIQTLLVSSFFGFRDISVGSDTANYVHIYLTKQTYFEAGMVVINKIIFFIFRENWRIYLFLISLIISFNINKAYSIIFKEDNKYLCLAYWGCFSMPYMIMMQVNIIRQGLATSFFIFGICLYFIKLNRKIGIIFILSGCFIHYSIFVLTIMFFLLYNIKIKKSILIFLIFFILLISIFHLPEKFILLLPKGSYIERRFSRYLLEYNSFFYYFKFFFYFVSYIYSCYIDKYINDLKYSILNKTLGILLLTSAFLSTSELVSMRFLLSADVVISLIYIYPQKVFKNKSLYVFFYIIFTFILYIYSLNSYAFKVSVFL